MVFKKELSIERQGVKVSLLLKLEGILPGSPISVLNYNIIVNTLDRTICPFYEFLLPNTCILSIYLIILSKTCFLLATTACFLLLSCAQIVKGCKAIEIATQENKTPKFNPSRFFVPKRIALDPITT